MIQPPSEGPAIGPTRVVIDHSASAVDDFCLGQAPSSSACESGASGPATAPCRIRAASRVGRFGAIPHSQEASTNSRIAVTNRRTWPKRWVSQPVSGIDTALAAAKIVITQVPSSTETPSSPEMVGIATFAIDESSTFMNIASDTATVPSASLAPVRGRGTVEENPWP